MIHLPLLSSHSLNKSYVCLICYKRFVKAVPSSPVVKVEVETGSQQDEPLNILTKEDDQHHNHDHDNDKKKSRKVEPIQKDKQSSEPAPAPTRSSEDIYRRFLRFTERYLKLTSTVDYFRYHANQLKNLDSSGENGKKESIEAFCANCRDTISKVCDLQQDIEERQLYLLERLDSFGNLMKMSTKKVSLKLERSLGKVLAQQLNVKAVSRVLTFRKIIQLKCKKKMTRNAPKVQVHRGLFPDQWKFSRAATKRELARLIFVFSLAHWSPIATAPKISEFPPKLKERLPNARSIKDENGSDIRRRRKKVRKSDNRVPQKMKLEVQVKKETCEELIKKESLEQLGEYKAINEDDHEYNNTPPASPLNNTEDNSDPEWNSQDSPPQSPEYQISSSDKEESSDSSDPDFQTSSSSKKRTRRITRRTSKTLSTAEADADPIETEDTSMRPTKRKRRRRTSPPPPPEDLPFHCDKCPEKSFRNHLGLRRHLRTIHHINPEYPCEICGVILKNFLEMTLHKKKMHPYVKVPHKNRDGSLRKKYTRKKYKGRSTSVGFECKKCGEFFTLGSEFQAHCRLHSTKVLSEDFGGKLRRNFLEGEEPPPRPKRQRKSKVKRPKLWKENKEMWTKCEVCGHQDTGYHLRKHLEDSHEGKEEDKKLLCYFCCKRFTHQQTLNLHVRAGHMGVSPKPLFFCHFEDKCEQPFLTWGELHDHMKKHLEGIKEDEVEENNKNDEGMEGKCVPKKKIFYCELCGWGTFFENYVEVHKMQHVEQQNGMYHCTKCPAKFERLASLTSHYNKVHGANVQPFKCPLCGVRTSSRSGMDIHVTKHQELEEVEGELGEGESQGGKMCREEDCGKSFPSMRLLTLHMQTEHNKGAEYRCEICDKRFYWPSLLKIHMRMHRDPEFECNICHLKFKRRLTMERHKTEKHLQEEDSEGHMKCSDPECDKMFVSRNLMHRHLARVHQKGPLVHMCQLCGQIFLNNSGLIQHQRFHDDPQWECDICHKQLKRGITLRHHKEIFHNPDRVYEQFICPTCGKIYKSSQGLKFHIDSAHTEESERRFSCPNCPRKFHRASLLRLHLKNCKTSEGAGEEGQSTSPVLQFKKKARGLTKKMMEFRRMQKMNTTSGFEPPYKEEFQGPSTTLPQPPLNSSEQVTMATAHINHNHEQISCLPNRANTNESCQNVQYFN